MLRITLAALTAAVLAGPAVAQDTTAANVEIVIARDVVDRVPVDSASTFPADVGQVACWTRVSGMAGDSIQHVWIHGEDEFPVTLQIGSPEWRTWSTKNIEPERTGEWRVEVRDATGAVLATARFTIGQ
jgi:hypothetical protein